MLYLKALVCKALFREFAFLAAQSKNSIDMTSLEWGLHDKVGGLNEALKEEIARIDSGRDIHTSYPPFNRPFDGILLGYGLCSNGVAGLSSEKYPLIIPRGHDCITLLLGSKERYSEIFAQESGTYWFSPGWIENSDMPGEHHRNFHIELLKKRYEGVDTETLVEVYEKSIGNYARTALVSWREFENTEFSQAARKAAKDSAEYLGWNYEEFSGSSSLVKDLLAGNWDEERFLVVPPGRVVKASYDERIITY